MTKLECPTARHSLMYRSAARSSVEMDHNVAMRWRVAEHPASSSNKPQEPDESQENPLNGYVFVYKCVFV